MHAISDDTPFGGNDGIGNQQADSASGIRSKRAPADGQEIEQGCEGTAPDDIAFGDEIYSAEMVANELTRLRKCRFLETWRLFFCFFFQKVGGFGICILWISSGKGIH